MAPNSGFTPKASLTEAPTNLKEAIDWVLRVTGKDGKGLGDECICGLASAVTDLLQSVTLEYHGYQGDTKETDSAKGASEEQVTGHLNGLFSLVRGLGGTAVVRTYIDQLAQVLSALVGWSSITKCNSGGCGGKGGNDKPHGKGTCKYLEDIDPKNKCDSCGCMKWDVPRAGENKGHHLGRRCRKCEGQKCGQAAISGGGNCTCKCKDDASCTRATTGDNKCQCDRRCCCTIGTYRSAYRGRYRSDSYIEGTITAYRESRWNKLRISPDRNQCARILLGSVCLIWSGLTYMYWTGKYHDSSPRWNNHILDGSGLDDGTLSQWLQALGFPRDMLNNSGPGNRLDGVIWDGISDKLLLGFAVPKGLLESVAKDSYGNTARNPTGMNFAGFIHTAHRDSFNNDGAIVFPQNGTGSSNTDTCEHKRGALFKLYILSCAYFTGLQKKTPPKAENKTPKTIREILYWLSALPYSQAYPKILEHGKHRLEKVLEHAEEKQLKFIQTDRPKPITVDVFNLFAHFQAVTQYCPLVLIGIQGGIHSTKSTDKTLGPAIHALYANTECKFTYPSVDIQAYNQVVHYIRALFYQLYFLRKQCAVKVALGGKWRECRYGSGVLGKGVVSWMCLGCDPMEHDRKCRVGKMGDKLIKLPLGTGGISKALRDILVAIGNVVVQLGNAQEALEGKAEKAIERVKEEVRKAKEGLDKAKQELEKVNSGGLKDKLDEAKKKLVELTNGGSGKLGEVVGKLVSDSSAAKDNISAAIHILREALDAFKNARKDLDHLDTGLAEWIKDKLTNEITIHLKEACNSPKCPGCKDHSTKCGQTPTPIVCETCHQPTTTGVPSPLQAFLEDRLPGFSCDVVRDKDEDHPDYPPAASHLGHCGGSGQCCPLPMGFRGQFSSGSTSDSTGQRLYGILYFFSNENMMQSCVYTLVRVTAELSATTPQVLGDVFGFFRGGVGNKERGKTKNAGDKQCDHQGDPSQKKDEQYFCGWCASGLREEVKKIEWIPKKDGDGGKYRGSVGEALINIKGDKDSSATPSALSALTKDSQYLSPLTGELYTAVSATFGGTYLSWVLYLSDALEGGLKSLTSEFLQIECRGCKGQCDPNKCKKGSHGVTGDAQCRCQSIVSCTGVLPVLYRHGFSYGNPFNLEGYQQKDKEKGQYDIKKDEKTVKHCHEFLESLQEVIRKKEESEKKSTQEHPLTELLKQVGKLQYDIRLPWIFVLTVAWLVAVLYLAFGAIWPLDWTHMRSHWLRGGAHQWQCMWYKVMTGRKGVELVEYFGRR